MAVAYPQSFLLPGLPTAFLYFLLTQFHLTVVRTWWSLLMFLLGCTNKTFFFFLQNSTHIGSSIPCCHLSALEWEMGHWHIEHWVWLKLATRLYFSRAMGKDVNNYQQCAVTLPTLVQPEQAAWLDPICVWLWNTVSHKSQRQEWILSSHWQSREGARNSNGICVTGRETDCTRGRWAVNTASIVNGMLRFLSVCFHCFDYRQQPPGWCHRLASAKCSSSFEWLGKAQT